uniref:Uncharacterized protein n=1 Tax=Tanacetum cinerariifolium TaxID=118510 RepID=A0A699IIP2_TANCI|nr:hypothetical protein [Tanacetum cinerariifolium]
MKTNNTPFSKCRERDKWSGIFTALVLVVTEDFHWNQTNGNVGTKSNIDAGQAGKKIVHGLQYAANTNSTNRLNIVSPPVNAVSSSFTIVDPRRERTQRNEFKSMFGQDDDANGNRMFTSGSAAGSTYVNFGGSIPVNAATLPNVDLPIDPRMPDLEDNANL